MRSKVGPSPERGADRSNLGVLGKGKCVFHIDAEIADRVLDLAMAEQDLDGTQIAGCPVDDRCLRSAERVRTVFTSDQTDPCHPFIDKPGVLASAEMPITIDPTGEDVVVHRAAPPLQPSQQAGASVWKQLELNRSACFLLHDNRSRSDLPTADKVADPHLHQVAASEFAVDRQIEQRPISQASTLIEIEPNFPNLLRFEGTLCTDGSSGIPHLPLCDGALGFRHLHDRSPMARSAFGRTLAGMRGWYCSGAYADQHTPLVDRAWNGSFHHNLPFAQQKAVQQLSALISDIQTAIGNTRKLPSELTTSILKLWWKLHRRLAQTVPQLVRLTYINREGCRVSPHRGIRP